MKSFCHLAILFSSFVLPSNVAAQTADTIWHGGPIITVNDGQPTAEAVAVKDGRIIAVGEQADVLAHRGDETKLVDLAGRTMLPGFVDSHGHTYLIGLQATTANLLPPPDGGGKDIASLQSIPGRLGEQQQRGC